MQNRSVIAFSTSQSIYTWQLWCPSGRIVVVTVVALIIGMILGRRLALLLSKVQHAAFLVFIDSIKPAAAQRIIIKGIVVAGIVAEYPTRPKSITNQRTRIFFFSGRNINVVL